MPPPVVREEAPRFALRGRIVTMDPHHTVLDDGVLYISHGVIDAVRPSGAPRPPGHEETEPVDTGGTVYPGLIELHNHLPYDVLPLWRVPRRYGNRSQWGGRVNPDYRRLVTGPMTVLGEDPSLMPAVVRYVEAKALINGTTTSQGIALFSNAGSRRMYRGIVRNVEVTDLMAKLTPDPATLEPLAEGAPARRGVQLHQMSADPIVAGLTLAEATSRLTRALADLPARARRAAERPPAREEGPGWRLALDEIRPNGTGLRPCPRLPLRGAARPGPGGLAPRDGRPPAALTALVLDALTAGADPDFLESLAVEPNPPPDYGAGLSALLT
ncbi:hypothetical protein [Streptomyces sp. NPDC005336]|uniref:amidohydrolase family protein n=1 Tax=unclassified Streptomyces TaxID=2593676 RepID=UPI0033B5ACD6